MYEVSLLKVDIYADHWPLPELKFQSTQHYGAQKILAILRRTKAD